MKRREFFKVTAGVVVSATAGGLLEPSEPELPDLPDPDYDCIVTSAFPVEEPAITPYTIGAEKFDFWNLRFPHGGGEARIPGFSHIKTIVATGVDSVGCQVGILPSGIPYPQGAPEMWFFTPAHDMSLQIEPWIQCTDGLIKADGEALLMLHIWRPKLA